MKRFLTLLLFTSLALFSAEDRVRVVSLSPALTELVCRLGQEALLAGRSSACDFPPGILRVPVAGAFGRPNPEAVIALKPTHLFADVLADPSAAELFRPAGIRVILKPCRNPAEYMEWVELAGKELNCEVRARAETARVRRELEDARRKYPPGSGPSVLCLIRDNPPVAAGSGSFPDALIRLAGLRNIAGNAGREYFTPSAEWLLAHQADILLLPGFPEERVAAFRKDRLWSCFRAVRNGRIVSGMDPDLLLRPGPRMTDGIRLLAERCHNRKGN